MSTGTDEFGTPYDQTEFPNAPSQPSPVEEKESGSTPGEMREFGGEDVTRQVREGFGDLGVKFPGITWHASDVVVECAIKPLRDEIARLRGLLRPYVKTAAPVVSGAGSAGTPKDQRMPTDEEECDAQAFFEARGSYGAEMISWEAAVRMSALYGLWRGNSSELSSLRAELARLKVKVTNWKHEYDEQRAENEVIQQELDKAVTARNAAQAKTERLKQELKERK